jgi:uncharacterized membrane protein YfcA
VTALGFALAVVIGLSLGLLGGGGSILTLPVLVYILGVSVKQAVPMSLVVVGTTSLFGAVSHQRSRNVRWDTALSFGPPAMIGAFIGAQIGLAVASRVQLAIFGMLMLGAAGSMYFGPALWGARVGVEARERRSLALIALLGLGVGMITGLVGIGGGFLYVPALVLLGGLMMKHAVGTSLVLIIMSCLAGLISYAGKVAIPWGATAIFTGLAIVGVLAGSSLVRRVSQDTLRRAFAVLLVVMGVLVLLRPRT